MKDTGKRLINFLHTVRGGLLLVGLLLGATLALVPGAATLVATHAQVLTARSPTLSFLSPGQPSSAELQINSTLSHGKVVAGSAQTIYLGLEIISPADSDMADHRRPSDLIVVLDRSGSMDTPQKMPLAKAAIRDLVGRLGPEDRFGLLSFDSHARLDWELQRITRHNQETLLNRIDQLRPGSATNIEAALVLARRMLPQDAARSVRVLLLSDGLANQGVSHREGLAQLARSLGPQTVLSTIGLGLDFSEQLLATMADEGMGNYSYLEDLSTLDSLFARELVDATRLFASHAELHIRPGAGLRVTEAAGYPLRHQPDGHINIPIGRLVSGGTKRFDVAFALPALDSGPADLGTIELRYLHADQSYHHRLDSTQLAFQVVPLERRHEALAALRTDLVQDVWRYSKLGELQQRYRDSLGRGDFRAAGTAIADYRRQAEKAEREIGAKLLDEEVARELSRMDKDLDLAVAAPAKEKGLLQNQLRKAYHEKGRVNQRYHK